MGDKSGAKINPLEGIVGTAKASYARQFSEHIHMKTSGTEEGKKHPDNILDEKNKILYTLVCFCSKPNF